MCDNHSGVLLEINGRPQGIDACIAPLVKILNDAGYGTVASCCGHGGVGSIALRDGRELLIAPDFETARLVELKMRASG